eukprot:jgi/Mesen1/10510/ME000083S10017
MASCLTVKLLNLQYGQFAHSAERSRRDVVKNYELGSPITKLRSSFHQENLRLQCTFKGDSFVYHHRKLGRTARASPQTRKRDGARAALDALIFDCDGVILESEDLHRRAYNATFEHFNVQCPGSSSPVVWTPEFYDDLQNRIGGGKPKMRWYFGEHGWPTSTISPSAPTGRAPTIRKSSILARPGVLQTMDAARAQGYKVAVCSAATRGSVVVTLGCLLGKERFESLDCFLAGDDVEKKKPDPSIYKLAAQKLGVDPQQCLVVEDSAIGLKAALGADMRCIITYTSSTKSQAFEGASAVVEDLSSTSIDDLVSLVSQPMGAA